MDNIWRAAAKESVARRICTPQVGGCGEYVKEEDFHDDVSRRESKISGLCQSCQDRIFADDEDG
jgi:hypothetical protein